MKIPRVHILMLAMLVLAGVMVVAQSHSLTVERHGDYLKVAAPQIRFLAGKAQDTLHDGSTVDYVITLTAAGTHDRKLAVVLKERFSVSFDLWEEKYSVVQRRQDGRSSSRLTAAMAEEWLLDAMPLPVRALPDREPFVVRLECFVDKTEIGNDGKNRSGLTLAGLIDVFSRKENEKPLRWEASSSLLRLSDLKNGR